MSVSVTYRSDCTVVQSIEGEIPLATTDKGVTHSSLNRTVALSASTTPDAELVAETRVTLVAGAGTLDLTAIATSTGTVNGTGKKVRVYKFRAPSTNSGGAIAASKGASNGYDMLGGSWNLPVGIDCEIMGYAKDTAAAVDSTHKTIDFAGTGTDSIDVIIVFG